MRSLAFSLVSSVLPLTLACSSGGGKGDSQAQTPEEQAETLLEGPQEEWARFLHYARDDTFDRLVLEVDAAEGTSPSQVALESVAATISGILDKPAGVEVLIDDELTAQGSDHLWQFDALDTELDAHFDGDGEKEIRIHIAYVDGSYDSGGEGTVLGLAWKHRSIAMFIDSISAACAGLPLLSNGDCESAEEAILLHEVGHVLGLVDNGLPMVEDHRTPDAEKGAHDVDPECVMYWAYDGPQVFDALGSLLGSTGKLTYCEESLADIRAVQK